MARRVAVDIPDGATSTSGSACRSWWRSSCPRDREVIYHVENGLLGMGPTRRRGSEDPELINAGKKPVTAIPGAAYFHHADSFVMIRGGHIDICVLGAMQVSPRRRPRQLVDRRADDAIPAVGGAMDLVAGVRTIWVITQHTTKTGEPKIVESCTYPLTGRRCVDRIYTDLAVIDITRRAGRHRAGPRRDRSGCNCRHRIRHDLSPARPGPAAARCRGRPSTTEVAVHDQDDHPQRRALRTSPEAHARRRQPQHGPAQAASAVCARGRRLLGHRHRGRPPPGLLEQHGLADPRPRPPGDRRGGRRPVAARHGLHAGHRAGDRAGRAPARSRRRASR
jgi:3-oxoadipate CoA-transferase, beta subunit